MKKHVFLRLIVIVMVLAMVLPMMGIFADAATAGYYTDVSSDSEYYDAVNYLYEHNIMRGVTDSRFYPTRRIKSEELMDVLGNMLNRPNEDTITGGKSTKLILPPEKGSFISAGTVTIEEAVIILYDFIKYCGYDLLPEAMYRTLFVRNMKYSSTYTTDAHVAVGWAYHAGLITKTSKGTTPCTRGMAANYIYQIYKKYQKKYALTVVNTYDMDAEPFNEVINAASECGDGMAAVFENAGADTAIKEDLYDLTAFNNAMKEAFSNAKALDICYLFCYSHGTEEGLYLFQMCYIDFGSQILTPTLLREQIDKYNGTFVTFISGCHTGTYVNKGINSNARTEDSFNAESFAAQLVSDGKQEQPSGTDLRDENGRIKVLCSSQKDELSSRYLAGFYWAYGMGYHLDTDMFYEAKADTSKDGRVSLQELYKYSYDAIIKGNDGKQKIVCYPENDNFIIYETGS